MGKGHSVGMHDILYVLKKSGWIFLLGLAVFLLLIPFSTAGLPGNSIFNIEVTHEQMKFRLFHSQAIPLIIGAALGLGLCAGLSLFQFVQDKKKVTIFFSMGITRKRLFINRAVTGVLVIAGSIILPMLLSLWLNFTALGGYQGLVRNTVYLTVGICFIAFISFFITGAVCFVSGTLSETLVYWAGVLSIPTVVCYGAGLLMNKLYWGCAWGVITYSGSEQIRPSLIEQMASFNPLLFFYGEMKKHGQFVRPLSTDVPEEIVYGSLFGWMAVCLILAVLAWYLLKKRKAETAGVMGTNGLLSELVIALTGFLIFSLSFSFLYDFHIGLAIGLGAVAFVAVHLFWRKTLFVYKSGWKRAILSAAGQGVVIIAVYVCFSSGFFGSAERFLAREDIESASVSYIGAPSMLYTEASGSSTGRGYYITSRLVFTETETIEKVKELQELFLDSGRKEMTSGETMGETVVPYDICFSYVDAKGKEHIWYYDRASYGQLEQMLSLEDEPEMAKKQMNLFTGDGEEEGVVWAGNAYSGGSVYMTDGYFSKTYELDLTDDQRKDLLHTVANDLGSMSLEERYFPDDPARAVLMFTYNGEQDCQYFTYHLDNTFLYLTSSYTHTLAWLEENHLLELIQEKPDVELIYLQKLDPYIGINGQSYPMGMYFMAYCADTDNEFLIQKDFGNHITITDEAEIQELLNNLQDGYFMSRGGYLAAVKLKDESRYRYLFLPADKVPSFVRG